MSLSMTSQSLCSRSLSFLPMLCTGISGNKLTGFIGDIAVLAGPPASPSAIYNGSFY